MSLLDNLIKYFKAGSEFSASGNGSRRTVDEVERPETENDSDEPEDDDDDVTRGTEPEGGDVTRRRSEITSNLDFAMKRGEN